MSDLERRNLMGLYWFINHADCKGSLSCGQVSTTQCVPLPSILVVAHSLTLARN
jgi:hypothetical protein